MLRRVYSCAGYVCVCVCVAIVLTQCLGVAGVVEGSEVAGVVVLAGQQVNTVTWVDGVKQWVLIVPAGRHGDRYEVDRQCHAVQEVNMAAVVALAGAQGHLEVVDISVSLCYY